MDSTSLVESQTKDGGKLVEELPRCGFEVLAACWLRTTQDEKWRFYIVSPIVERDSLVKAYRQLQPLIRAMPQPFAIDPLEITLLGPNDPVGADILAVLRRTLGIYPLHWGGRSLGGVTIDGAYFYPIATPGKVTA
jgi:hypothetical protein